VLCFWFCSRHLVFLFGPYGYLVPYTSQKKSAFYSMSPFLFLSPKTAATQNPNHLNQE
jgi:hypothetical protein